MNNIFEDIKEILNKADSITERMCLFQYNHDYVGQFVYDFSKIYRGILVVIFDTEPTVEYDEVCEFIYYEEFSTEDLLNKTEEEIYQEKLAIYKETVEKKNEQNRIERERFEADIKEMNEKQQYKYYLSLKEKYEGQNDKR